MVERTPHNLALHVHFLSYWIDILNVRRFALVAASRPVRQYAWFSTILLPVWVQRSIARNWTSRC